MGRQVGPKLAARFARAILELGGNNAAIVAPTADLDLALRGIAFSAMGTAGQRCTTLRRLFVHDSVYDRLVPRLKSVYGNVAIGDPRQDGVLVGPLIDKQAFDGMERALDEARAAGGTVHGRRTLRDRPSRTPIYARPALVEMPAQSGPVLRETFAPILYVMRYTDFDEVIEAHNAVGAGLSSSIFTLDMREAETLHLGGGLGLRHRQRQYRTLGRRDRRRLRRREGDRRRPRGRLGCLEGLYAPGHQHAELRPIAAPGAGRHLRRGRLTPRIRQPWPRPGGGPQGTAARAGP